MKLEGLIARDGRICVWCGHEPWRSDLTAEHLLPRSRGGQGMAENLAVACRTCNRRRRSRSVAAYVREQRQACREPRLELLCAALGRLSQTASRRHAEFARRELELLGRLEEAVPG